MFMKNFPMYARLMLEKGTDEVLKVLGRYNRVDNYANITTIHSAMGVYESIYKDPEIIVQKLSQEYGGDIDFIRIIKNFFVKRSVKKERSYLT